MPFQWPDRGAEAAKHNHKVKEYENDQYQHQQRVHSGRLQPVKHEYQPAKAALTDSQAGSRIINSSVDDAGGLAVSMKLSAAIRRTDATSSQCRQRTFHFLQVQDGVMKNGRQNSQSHVGTGHACYWILRKHR
jgi:hypothetical protein